MATKQRKKQMSDLEIMFDEAYDAPVVERIERLATIANLYKTSINVIESYYLDYIDSDAFYAKRGI
jgi:hypothetical protein